jgi:hypothetical protein
MCTHSGAAPPDLGMSPHRRTLRKAVIRTEQHFAAVRGVMGTASGPQLPTTSSTWVPNPAHQGPSTHRHTRMPG